MFWDFSRRVTEEDRLVLETTSPDFPTEVTSEVHLRCDRTTLEYRRILGRLASSQPPVLSPLLAPTGGVS